MASEIWHRKAHHQKATLEVFKVLDKLSAIMYKEDKVGDLLIAFLLTKPLLKRAPL